MPDPEISPPPADPSASTDESVPADRRRRYVGLIIAVLVLIVVVCCVCLLAAGLVWYLRQGNTPFLEDMLQVLAPGLVQVVG